MYNDESCCYRNRICRPAYGRGAGTRNRVVCVDKLADKINKLNRGELTLYEDGLEELFKKNVSAGALSFTTDMESAVKDADIAMLAVGTPPHPLTKEADLKYIYAAAEELARYLNGYTVVATVHGSGRNR